jgi:hypothetical protein
MILSEMSNEVSLTGLSIMRIESSISKSKSSIGGLYLNLSNQTNDKSSLIRWKPFIKKGFLYVKAIDGFEIPTILTYSLESTISEKLDAIVRFMELTGCMKDFYDIYYTATSFDFEGRKVQDAIYETFLNRGTPIEKDSVQAFERLITNEAIMNRWDKFCKNVLKYELNLDGVIQLIMSFLDPPFQAMIEETELIENWNSTQRQYT